MEIGLMVTLNIYLPGIILEEVDPLPAACSCYVLQVLAIALVVEGIIHLFHCDDPVADADGCGDRLAGLISSPILDSNVLSSAGPSLHLKTSAPKYTFVAEDEMPLGVQDLLNSDVQLDDHLLELIISRLQPIGNIGHYD